MRRRADAVLAILRRAADELPLRVRQVGDRDGDRQRCEEGGGGAARGRGDGWRQRQGYEGEGDGVEGESSRSGAGWWILDEKLGPPRPISDHRE